MMGTDFLSRIIENKQAQVQSAKRKKPVAHLRGIAECRTDYRPFIAPFATAPAGRINIIAEIKRASPSRGVIRDDLDAAKYAAAYEKGGAVALSVLTETEWFKGSIDDLQTARRAGSLPVLRKDFIVSDYQVYESACIGADAVLLIVRILSGQQLTDYLALCRELCLDALVEVHTPGDLEQATAAGAVLIGINNRNLKSFDTDIQTAMEMVARFSTGQVPVAASGIASRADIEVNLKAGIRNFLIGETLVRADDPEGVLRSLIQGSGFTVRSSV